MPDTWKPPVYAQPTSQGDSWKPPDYAQEQPTESAAPDEGILAKFAQYLEGPTTIPNPKTGEPLTVTGQGYMKVPGMERAGEWIRNKGINTGNYYLGAAGSILGDIVGGAATGFDPRTAGVVRAPVKEAAPAPIPEPAPEPPKYVQPKLLGPAPPQPGFIAGPKGVAINKPYTVDLGPTTPRIGQQEAGTILPREVEGLSQIPPDLAARHGLNIGDIAPINEEDKLLRNIQQLTNEIHGNYPKSTGKYELPTAVKPPRVYNEKPEILHEAVDVIKPNGDAPPLEEIKRISQPPEEAVNPPAGSARIKDISLAESTGSADQMLERRAPTKPIVQLIRNNGWDKMQEAIGSEIRQLGDITDGLSKNQLEAFGRIAEGIASEEDKALIPGFEQRLTDYRALMDKIFTDTKIARGGDLGYIEDYFTHIKKLPDDDLKSAVQDLFNYREGKSAWKAFFERPEIGGEGTDEAAGIYGKGVGQVAESPYTKTRTGALKDIDYNINKIGRLYIESTARERFLRPAVEQATALIKDLPDSKMKELAEAYVKNVTRFDSAPNLNQAYKKVVRFIIDTTGRSMLGFNPHLQALHAMRLGPVYTELGSRYSAIGLGNILKNPAAAYRETAELGMLPNELYPFKFQTGQEKVNSILNFKSMVDFLDRSIAYNGFKAKYLDSGLAPELAKEQAIVDAKRVTFMTDPSRANLMLTPEYKNVPGRLVAQYKQVPAKIAEWIVRTAADAKQNPAKAARMVALLGGSTALKVAGGPDMFHMPLSLADWSAASVNEMRKIVTYAVKGDVDKAAEEFALWMTPAGLSTKRLLTR